jgi:hypothetical protein
MGCGAYGGRGRVATRAGVSGARQAAGAWRAAQVPPSEACRLPSRGGLQHGTPTCCLVCNYQLRAQPPKPLARVPTL